MVQEPSLPTPAKGVFAQVSGLLGRWDALERPFASLPRAGAIALLAALLAAMVWGACFVEPIDGRESPTQGVAQAPTQQLSQAQTEASGGRQKGDLALYKRIADRVASGESYYAAATYEQRASNYPTHPFVTVRQPTLAWMQSFIGVEGVRYIAIGLLGGCLFAFYARFAGRTGIVERAGGVILVLIGGIAATIPVAGLVHEIVAGLLLTLSFLAYDRGRYWPSLIAAALAIAVRDIAIAFVLLWFTYSLAQSRWREALWVGVLIVGFSLGMYGHYLGVDAYSSANEPTSQGWEAFAGYGLPIAAFVKLSFLQALPIALAAPLALLPLLGWLGLGGREGLFASLWFVGHATALALFARPENFYWIQLILPAYAIGFAFAPRAIYELIASAVRGPTQAAA